MKLFKIALAVMFIAPGFSQAADMSDGIAKKRERAEIYRQQAADVEAAASVPPGNHSKLDEERVKQAIIDYSNRRNGRKCDKTPYSFTVSLISIGGYSAQLGGHPAKYIYTKTCGNDTIKHEAIDINIRIKKNGSYEAFKPKWIEDGEDEMNRKLNDSMKKAFK